MQRYMATLAQRWKDRSAQSLGASPKSKAKAEAADKRRAEEEARKANEAHKNEVEESGA